ncbi:hypothetical protein [Pantoea piersonii]|uniref:hypothetical protein n=1 Tax=Pantoea piersonii TaxID=2364647 RepID=UPI002FDB0AC4
MAIKCPKCNSENVDKKNYATKTLAAVGGLAAGIAVGAKAFDAISDDSGTDGSLLTATGLVITGGIIGAAMGAAVGGVTAGAMLGSHIDEKIMDNFICLKCDYTFSNA